MDARELNQNFDLLSLVENATTLKRSGAYHIGPCPLCGGVDRFNLKRTATGWRWLCRKCSEGRYKTPIDFVMQRDGVDFRQALEVMGGKIELQHGSKRIKPAAPVVSLPDPAWQNSAWQRVERATSALRAAPGGSVASFLDRRGLTAGTREAFWLGADTATDPVSKRARPALMMPWCDRDTVTAFSFRFVDAPLDGEKRYKTYGQKEHNARLLFGLQNTGGARTLVIFEGEINAMSVWQAAANAGGMDLDCVSIGAQTPSTVALEMLRRLSANYARRVLWMDDKEIAAYVLGVIGATTKLICSPVVRGVKYDANEMLQGGLLADFLRRELASTTLSRTSILISKEVTK